MDQSQRDYLLECAKACGQHAVGYAIHRSYRARRGIMVPDIRKYATLAAHYYREAHEVGRPR